MRASNVPPDDDAHRSSQISKPTLDPSQMEGQASRHRQQVASTTKMDVSGAGTVKRQGGSDADDCGLGAIETHAMIGRIAGLARRAGGTPLPRRWDGRGAWRDNVFVERLWRSVKYEEVYLKAYDSVSEARSSIGRYLTFHNHRRPHSSLDRRTPDEAYFTPSPLAAAA